MEKLDKPKGPPYRFAHNNNWLTAALFYERMNIRPKGEWVVDPVFTLFDKMPGYISARETFLYLNDPTGYKWAMKYLGDFRHWKILMDIPWFRDVVATWVEELEIVLKSEMIERIRGICDSEDEAKALAAAKYLHSEAYKQDKPKATRGRPTTAEKQGELKRQVTIQTEEDKDFERLGLKLLKGGKE